MDNVKNLFKLVDIDLPRCGSFGSGTEGKGGTKGFASETADNTGSCHGHGNDRAVGELLGEDPDLMSGEHENLRHYLEAFLMRAQNQMSL